MSRTWTKVVKCFSHQRGSLDTAVFLAFKKNRSFLLKDFRASAIVGASFNGKRKKGRKSGDNDYCYYLVRVY